MITAAKTVRPNTIYRVNVVVLPEAPELNVKATITKGHHQIASHQQLADTGSNTVLLLPVLRFVSLLGRCGTKNMALLILRYPHR